MTKSVNLAGQQYGEITVMYRKGRNRQGRALWRCVCRCGQQFDAASNNLQRGYHKACNINGHRWTGWTGWIEQRGLKRHCVE